MIQRVCRQFVRTASFVAGLALAAGVSGCATPPTSDQADTLSTVKANGVVACGVSPATPGFSTVDTQGRRVGLDVDLCRAIAVAVFADANKVRFVPTSIEQRFQFLDSGVIDVLIRTSAQLQSREAALKVSMAGTNFYDGQGFIVKRTRGIRSAKQLDGVSVCMQPIAAVKEDVDRYFRVNGMRYTPVLLGRHDENISAYLSGRCDVYQSGVLALAVIRGILPVPGEHEILPERVSNEPLGPFVRLGDQRWLGIVKAALAALIEAEELGISKANALSTSDSENPRVKRFRVETSEFAKRAGLDEKWAFNVIHSVGNYGESYERNIGPGTSIGLARSVNQLKSNGGMIEAPPLR